MIFLIQKFDNNVYHDYIFELKNAIRYQRSFNGRDDISYRECTFDKLKSVVQYNKEYIPIGTVEFVSFYFKKFFNHSLKPINIPQSLMDEKYTKRIVFYFNKHMEGFNENKKFFIKDHKIVKRKGFPKVDYLTSITDNNVYQVSEIINIESEYRCFVHNNDIVDVRRYSGSLDMFPDFDYIYDVVDEYSRHDAPKSYTLDVGINNEIGTFIIEIHDFYSCGFYGFADYKKIPFMFSQWYYNKLIYINKKQDNNA